MPDIQDILQHTAGQAAPSQAITGTSAARAAAPAAAVAAQAASLTRTRFSTSGMPTGQRGWARIVCRKAVEEQQEVCGQAGGSTGCASQPASGIGRRLTGLSAWVSATLLLKAMLLLRRVKALCRAAMVCYRCVVRRW